MRGAGLPVDTLIAYVRMFQEGDDTIEERKALLVEQRDALAKRILDMQSTLDRLNMKIKRYEDLIVPVENELKNLR
jgi:DNA-binding transcriptional MerR regulator